MEENKNLEEIQVETEEKDAVSVAEVENEEKDISESEKAEISEQEEEPKNEETPGKGKKVWRIILRVASYVLTAILAAVLVIFLIAKDNNNPQKSYVRMLINTYYDGDVDRDKMDEGEIAGMVAGLGDPHSYYIPKEIGMTSFEETVTGEYAGIGISMLQKENKDAIVNQVFKDSPAEKAGMKQGDVFYEVNGKSAVGKDLEWLSGEIRGEEGTDVEIKVKRGDEILSFTVTRAKVDSPSVTYEVLEGNIGYVKLSQFDADSHDELKKAMDEMGNIKGVIIDLRDNPGGLFDVCLATCDPFLGEKDIIIARYKGEEEISKADAEVLYDMPMVVLINENSASSSEIFAACMKDNGRATIVGTKSYGKGSIQTTFPLSGNAGVNLTIGHFYSPNGKSIDKVGVDPHISVEYNLPDGAKYDTQLQAAVDALKK
ncbi:MAG: S41 family peptidase [Clostridia bacterium]|nr:S41 family peptidase [Clostridia bacterium]